VKYIDLNLLIESSSGVLSILSTYSNCSTPLDDNISFNDLKFHLPLNIAPLPFGENFFRNLVVLPLM
jgi:hypothetical protein